MRNTFLTCLPLALLFFSCGGGEEKKQNDTGKKDSVVTEPTKPKFDTQKFTGQYMGDFGTSTIILSLNYVSGKNVSGYDIVRGNRRNIKGTIEPDGARYHFVMDEPGNDKYDGKFDFTIDTATFEVNGKFTPFKKDEKITEKTYVLKPLEKTKDSTNSFLGDWFGYKDETEGTLNMKDDGSFTYQGYYYGGEEGLDGEFNIRGNWIREDKKVTLEFDRNPYMKTSKLTLRYTEVEYGFALKQGEDEVFHKYMPNAYEEEY